MITDQQYDTLAQYNHVLFGSTIVFAAMDLYPPAMWFVIAAYVIYTAWKEFYYDQRYETPEVRGSNLKDFTFYQVGVMLALVIHFGVAWLKT